MGEPFVWELFPLLGGGINNQNDPAMLKPHEAQAASNIFLESGAMLGLSDATTALVGAGIPFGVAGGGTTTTGTKWMHYGSGNQWLSDVYYRYGLNDGDATYLTLPGKTPVIQYPWGQVPMGIQPPAYAQLLRNAGAGTLPAGKIVYAIVLVTDQGLTSNPLILPPVTTVLNDQIVINLPPGYPTDVRVGKAWLYRTLGSAGTGALYFLSEQTVAFGGQIQWWQGAADSGTVAPDSTRQLTWGPGGYSSSAGNLEDHTPWPVIDVLSNGIHSTTQATASGGIILAATGPILRASKYGQPNYAPTRNQWSLESTIEAIITQAARSLVFSQQRVYSVTGLTDETLYVAETTAPVGCRPGTGRAAVRTPFGTVFLARTGVMCFLDSGQLMNLSLQQLNVGWLAGLVVRGAVFWNNYYILFHDTGTLLMDMRAFPTVSFLPSPLQFAAWHRTAYPVLTNAIAAPSGAQALRELSGGVFLDATAALNGRACFFVGQGWKVTVGGTGGASPAGEYPGATWDAEVVDTAIRLYDATVHQWYTLPNGPGGRINAPLLGLQKNYLGTTTGPYLLIPGGSTDGTDGAVLASVASYPCGSQPMSGGPWSTIAAAGMTAVRRHAGFSSPTSANVWWYGGTDSTGTVKGILGKWHQTGDATGTYSTVTDQTAGYPRRNAALVYIEGGGTGGGTDMALVFGGIDAAGATQGSVVIIDKIGGALVASVDNTGPGLGWYARCNHQAFLWVDPVTSTNRIFVFGGQDIEDKQGQLPVTYGDLWEYLPGQSPSWVAHASVVTGLGDRSQFAAAIQGDKVWVFGGTNAQTRWNLDTWTFAVDNLSANVGRAENLFVLKDTATTPAAWASGSPLAWSWTTGDYTAGDPGTLKRLATLWANVVGQVAISCIRDGVTVAVYTTPTTQTRGAPIRVPFPVGNPNGCIGYRFALKFDGVAGSELHSARAVGTT